MKSNKRIVQRRAGATFRGGKADPSTEKKVEAARAMAERIAAEKLAQPAVQVEKDATQLTAEAIMKGTEATPVTLTVSEKGVFLIYNIFPGNISCQTKSYRIERETKLSTDRRETTGNGSTGAIL